MLSDETGPIVRPTDTAVPLAISLDKVVVRGKEDHFLSIASLEAREGGKVEGFRIYFTFARSQHQFRRKPYGSLDEAKKEFDRIVGAVRVGNYRVVYRPFERTARLILT